MNYRNVIVRNGQSPYSGLSGVVSDAEWASEAFWINVKLYGGPEMLMARHGLEGS